MKILLITVGKTTTKFLSEGIAEYCKRISRYLPFEIKCVSDAKNTRNLSEIQQKQKEGNLILASIAPQDYVVLLDEHGKEFTSREFAAYIERKMQTVSKQLVFVIGGPYGFSDEVFAQSNEKISLSKMTFSHEMVRMFFTEQLYRAMTIINNEPYHHD